MTKKSDENNQVKVASIKKGQVIELRNCIRDSVNRPLIDVRAYWHKQRKGDTVPARTDIQASGLGSAVDFAFIAERIAPGTARYRLAGRHLHEVMGMEVRGLPLASILRPSSREEFSDVLESVFKTPQIAEFWLTANSGYVCSKRTARLLLLPLKSDLGDVARVLGCLVTDGILGQTPRRFELDRYQISPVIPGGQTIRPKGSAPRATSEYKDGNDLTTKILPPSTSSATPEQRRLSFRVISNNEKPNGRKTH